jgi:hypothetical protein
LNDRPRSVEKLDTELHCRNLAVTTPDGCSDVCDTAYLLAIPHLNGRNGSKRAIREGVKPLFCGECQGASR